MSTLKLVRYFYFRLYKYYSEGPAPYFKVFAAVFVGIFFNFLTLSSLISILLKTRFTFFVVEKGIGRLWPLFFILPLYGIFAYYIKNKGRHSEIMKEFKYESAEQKRRSSLAVIAYFISSFALFFLSLWLRQMFMNF
jgi:hypothetical protein